MKSIRYQISTKFGRDLVEPFNLWPLGLKQFSTTLPKISSKNTLTLKMWGKKN